MGKQKGRAVPTKKKLFIIADAAVDTGFATVTHNLIDNLHTEWDIDVLGINYYGDPHPIQQKARIWAPTGVTQQDLYGFNRVPVLLNNIKPDVVLVINDPWIAAEYVGPFTNTPGKKVLYTPIDAKHVKPIFVDEINKQYHHVIAYTHFGANELTRAGLTLPTNVIAHGVDTQQFYPLDKNAIRMDGGLDPDWFIVQVVDRNQIRKRIDLALYYFAQWVHMTDKPDSVKLYYHGALLDEGWDLAELAKYLGIDDRLILSHRNLNPAHGFPLDMMKAVYSVADVKLSTTQGEGWGLTTMESMACRVAQIVPKYSALGEWTEGKVIYTDIDPIPYFSTKGVNTQAGIPTLQSTVKALELLYKDKDLRERTAQAGYELVTQKRFTWQHIAQEFNTTFKSVLKTKGVDDE